MNCKLFFPNTNGFLLILLLALSQNAFTQTSGVWQSFGPLTVGYPEIWTMLGDSSNPQNIYVGTDLGLFMSSNYGLTWYLGDPAIIPQRFLRMLLVDGVLYVGTASKGVFLAKMEVKIGPKQMRQ